jgi:branched-chain amino acid transport system permease protein
MLGLALSLAGYPYLATDYYVFVVNLAILASFAAIGKNLLTGNAGLVSVGNAAFLAIGAWTSVLVAGTLGFVASVLASALTCAAAGLVIGIPSLRLRNFYMALTTLALHFIVATAFFQYQVRSGNPTGFNLPVAAIGSIQFGDVRSWYTLLSVVLVGTLVLTRWLLNSRVGRAWLAIREHDVAAAVVGINVTYYKLLAFAVSSFYVGMAGALAAYNLRYVTAEAYSLDLAISYVAMIIIGGLGSLTGSVVGAFVVTLLPLVIQNIGGILIPSSNIGSFFTRNQHYIQSMVYGAIVLWFLYFEPRGVAGIFRRVVIRRLVGRRAGMAKFSFGNAASTLPGEDPALPDAHVIEGFRGR